MRNFTKSLANALPGGVLGAFAWYIVNRMSHVQGVGLLERQPWPLSSFWATAGCCALFALVSSWITLLWRDRTSAALAEEAERLGLAYQSIVGKKELEGAARLCVFEDWQRGSDYIYGDHDGVPIQFFHLTTLHESQSSEGGSHEEHRAFFVFPLDGEGAAVQIMRRSSLTWLLNLMGIQGLTLVAPEGASPLARSAVAAFGRKHLLLPGNSKLAAISGRLDAAELAAVGARLHLDLVQTLAASPWSLEFGPSHVALWRRRGRLGPGGLRAWLDEVAGLYRSITTTPLTACQVVGHAAERPSLKLPLICGLGGGALAFALFVPVFFLFVESAPWLVFLWPFFGFAMMAAAAGLCLKWQQSRARGQ